MEANENLLLRRQIELEQETLNSSATDYDVKFLEAIRKGGGGDTKEAIIIIKASIDLIEDYINAFYKAKGVRGNQAIAKKILKQYYPKPRDLAFIIIKQVLATSLKEINMPLLRFSKSLYNTFMMATKALALKETQPNLYSFYEKKYDKDKARVNSKKVRASKRIKLSGLSDRVKMILSMFIVDVVTKSGCDLISVTKQSNSTLVVNPSDNVKALLLRSKEFFLSKSMVFKPLLYKPRDWTGLSDSGGYYSYPKDIQLIKTRTGS